MKKNIALVTGGYSGEAQISYKSAITVEANIDTNLFSYTRIDITPAGWFYKDEDGNNALVNKEDFSVVINGNKQVFDGVLMCIHGTPGEDGKLQGYFDMLNIPYTTCDATTSALTFNKRYAVAVAAFGGIAVAKSVHLFKNEPYNLDEIHNSLQLPYFVKPNNGGSSIGMSKVSKTEDLQAAIEKAFAEDNQVLIEQMVQGREFTIGVYKTKEGIKVLPITEIEAFNDFFDFEAKYEGKSRETTPANISEEEKQLLENTVIKIYQILNCNGVVRIDIIYNEREHKAYMLEVNTVPGQSQASVIPQQVRAAGMDLKSFYTNLINSCFN